MTPHERAAELYVGGATTRQVGVQIGVHESTVRAWLDAAGVPLRPRGPRADPATPPKPVRARTRRTKVYDDPHGPLTTRQRRRVVTLLRRGHSPAEAAEQVGVTVQRIWGAARILPDWREQLDEAIGCTAEPQHSGTAYGYRLGCRCVDCRRARRERYPG